MADVSELKNMVMSFRVSELQVLLGFAGKNKSGRKQELLQRALVLVQKGCSTPIQIKIRDLYRRRFPGKAGNTTSPHSVHSPQHAAASSLRNYNGLDIKPSLSTRNGLYNHHAGTPSLGYPAYTSSSSIGPLDFSGKIPAHNSSSSSSSNHGNHNAVPIHPDVRLRNLPFYKVLGELLKPSSLAHCGQTRFQETFFVFHLTPQQAQDIAMSRDIRPGAKWDYTVQVQMRFCLLETSCEQEDNFPPSICVRVNGKMAPLPNPIPTNKPGVEPKRPSRPVNITQLCRISPTVPNHVNISWASEFGRGYCVAIYLVKRLSSDILLQKFKQKGFRHPDHSRALIKEKLAHDPDSEIATTSLRVSLKCPLGKMKMTTPCRATTCNHLQCFDAPTYIQMNEKKPTWICPVCDKPALFENLVIDGLFTEILRKSQDCSEIQFIEDGSWQPMKVKEEEPSQVIHTESTSESPKKKENDVIDLTCSSDEEAEPDETDKPSDSSSSSLDSAPSVMSVPAQGASYAGDNNSSKTTTSNSGGESFPPLPTFYGSSQMTSLPPPPLSRGPPPLTAARNPISSLDNYQSLEHLTLFPTDREQDTELADLLDGQTSSAPGGSTSSVSDSTSASRSSAAANNTTTSFANSLYNFGHSRSGGGAGSYFQDSSASSSPDVISLD